MKFKIPNLEMLKISLDRLTRFKPVSERYNRVFDDIISKCLINYDKKPNEFSLNEKIKLAVEILNSAIPDKSDLKLNEIIKEDEEKIFILNEDDKAFLNSPIDFEGGLKLFKLDELPLNLKKLKLQINGEKSDKIRENFSTLYPVSKIILVEGITEEILLTEFGEILGLNFNKKGFLVIGAGGKNQVARKYYKLIEEIKIPIFILLDADAIETNEIIKPKLRKTDEIYKIKSGEFEDILPKNLIKNALNVHFSENLLQEENEFIEEGKRVEELNNCYKNNGWGEFKKSDFAKIVREYLISTKNPPVSDELKLIIEKIKNL